MAAGDLREGDGCFTLEITSPDDFDPATESVLGEPGDEIALDRWSDTDCAASSR